MPRHVAALMRTSLRQGIHFACGVAHQEDPLSVVLEMVDAAGGHVCGGGHLDPHSAPSQIAPGDGQCAGAIDDKATA